MNVLVTGGAGYIGSHICQTLKENQFIPIVYDRIIPRNRHKILSQWGICIQKDLLDKNSLFLVFEQYRPVAIIHLASLIDGRTSSQSPFEYYQNNLVGLINLLNAALRYNLPPLIFSSTASVYGKAQTIPISETHPLDPVNPYGKSKKMIEEILADFSQAYGLKSAVLRYFNAAGADLSNNMGPCLDQIIHLIPRSIFAALGRYPSLKVFGNQHPTPDQTAVRDYIHVQDLAEAHIKTLKRLLEGGSGDIWNLGSGRGTSVIEVIQSVEKTTGKSIKVEFVKANSCEAAVLVADIAKAKKNLNWTPRYSNLETIVSTTLRWYSTHLEIHAEEA